MSSELVVDYDSQQGNADEDDVYSATIALKRIGALSCSKDLTAWRFFDGCLQLLSSRVETTQMEVELMVSALKCAAFHLMWAKVNAVNSTPKEAIIKILKREVRSFCKVCQACLSVTQADIRDLVFELLCDLLLLFSETSVRSEPALQTLVHLPSDSLRSEMSAFLLDYVFTDTDDEQVNGGVDEHMKITQLQRKRNQLAGYCKLVIYGVLDLSAMTDVFKHYSKYFKDYGDIIKESISKTKLINPVQSAKTVCLSLQQLFAEMLTEERSKQDLGEIRDLAKRLAMSFGIDLHRARKPLVALHMDGIRFAFRASQGEEELQNVPFLEVLTEFSFKLLPKDRAQLASFLKSECPKAALCWPPFRLYQRSLETQAGSKPKDHEAVSAHKSPVSKRKRTTANALALDSSGLHSSLPTPVLTSTVLKDPSKVFASGDVTGAESHYSSSLIEPQSEDEFSSMSEMRAVKRNKQCIPTIKKRAVEQPDLNSHLTLLSLIDYIEEEEPNIEDYESDSNHTVYSQVSNHPTTPSVLDELFH